MGTEDHQEYWLLYLRRGGGFIFAQAGIYRLRAMGRALVGRPEDKPVYQTLLSNEIEVVVGNPPTEEWAREIWRFPAQVGLFTSGVNPLDLLLADAETASGSYAAYARYALGRDAGRPSDQRIRYLRELTEGTNTPAQLMDLALLQLADLLLEAKDYPACKAAATRVLTLETAPPWSKDRARELMAEADARAR